MGQIDKYRESQLSVYLKQMPLGPVTVWNPSTVTDWLLENEYQLALNNKNSWGPVLGRPPYFHGIPSHFHTGEQKTLLCFGWEEGKNSNFYIQPKHSPKQNPALQEKLLYRAYRAYLTRKRGIRQFQPLITFLAHLEVRK